MSKQLPVSYLPGLTGFDVAKTSNWAGGQLMGDLLILDTSQRISYDYDCGNEFSVNFSLNVAVKDKADKAITMPEGLKNIEAEAFRGTDAKEYFIPNGVVSIGELAFSQLKETAYMFLPVLSILRKTHLLTAKYYFSVRQEARR